MNKKEVINYLKSYTEPPQMMKVFPNCEIIKEAITMLEQQDSLPKNLEKAALRYAIPAYMKDVDENYLHEYPRDPIAEKAFIAGAEWQKKQMLKYAVEGTLGYGPHLQKPIVMLEQVPDIWDGGCKPVKIIVIKED